MKYKYKYNFEKIGVNGESFIYFLKSFGIYQFYENKTHLLFW